MKKSKGDRFGDWIDDRPALAISLFVVGLILMIVVPTDIVSAVREAQAFEEVTGVPVTWQQAYWLKLYVPAMPATLFEDQMRRVYGPVAPKPKVHDHKKGAY